MTLGPRNPSLLEPGSGGKDPPLGFQEEAWPC